MIKKSFIKLFYGKNERREKNCTETSYGVIFKATTLLVHLNGTNSNYPYNLVSKFQH